MYVTQSVCFLGFFFLFFSFCLLKAKKLKNYTTHIHFEQQQQLN